ncbi:IS110 family transposase [Actinopolymorpha alba]|uniref:IS110 family transposase n=1 Tax=Actinopolymorpha alba TaxID=533267 RepID=UPI000363BA41
MHVEGHPGLVVTTGLDTQTGTPPGLPFQTPQNLPLRQAADQHLYAVAVDVLHDIVEAVGTQLRGRLAREPSFQALLGLPEIGPVTAGIFYAEIGPVDRFPTPRHLTSWAGLTPRHRESDTHVSRGSITKQGRKLVRWAAIEAVQKTPPDASWLIAARGLEPLAARLRGCGASSGPRPS